MIQAYIDDIHKSAYAAAKKNYGMVREDILKNKGELNFYLEEDGEIWGYGITRNVPVSQIFGFDTYVVRFYFSGADTLHNPGQERLIDRLIDELLKELNSLGGYINIRIPAHIVDLVKSFGKKVKNVMFCGGTVELFISRDCREIPQREGIRGFFADRSYIESYKKLLLDITYASFREYQGQYHLSPITCGKAGIIYEKWIEGAFDDFKENTIYITEYENEPIGYIMVREDEHLVSGDLAAVSKKHRNLGAYRLLMASAIHYALENNKVFAANTQFDNFISQGTWTSLGMRPYSSFYNYHLDLRGDRL